MSKTTAPTGIAWKAASADLIAKIKMCLQMAQNNRYSVSRIYAAHNAVFHPEDPETPQTCSTCLTSRIKRLREWWHANEPKEGDAPATPASKAKAAKTAAVATTGEAQEATSYEGVVAKYKLPIGEGLGETTDEGTILQPIVEAGAEASGMGVNEFALIEARYGELVGAKADAALVAVVIGKLNELGITKDSSNEDTLEAYEALAADVSNEPNEQAFYNAQIEICKRAIADDAEVVFTPASEDAQFGIATKGGQPLPAGNYDHEGQQYAVVEDGSYTVITGEPAGDAAKAAAQGYTVINMGEGVLGMHFTPNADDATKGTVVNADGSKVKAGTYTAADGTVIVAQVAGGKATIKS